MRLRLPYVALLIGLLLGAAPARAVEKLIVPGVSIGPIALGDSDQKVRQLLPVGELSMVHSNGPAGTMTEITATCKVGLITNRNRRS